MDFSHLIENIHTWNAFNSSPDLLSPWLIVSLYGHVQLHCSYSESSTAIVNNLYHLIFCVCRSMRCWYVFCFLMIKETQRLRSALQKELARIEVNLNALNFYVVLICIAFDILMNFMSILPSILVCSRLQQNVSL